MEPAFTIADWTVHPDSNLITSGGQRIRIEPRVMELLVYLAERQGEVLSRNQIFRDVWRDAEVGEGALLTAVSALRRALGDDPRHPQLIETIPKRGYRLIAQTSAKSAALAVLPFRDLSMHADQTYLAEGISELLLNDLGRTPRVRVIAWPSVATFRKSPMSVQEIAVRLGARYVLEGTVLQTGDRVRVSTRLNDTGRNTLLWADSFESPMEELPDAQRQLARRVEREICGSLAPPLRPRLPAAPASSDAMVAYLRGRFHWYKMTPEHFGRAKEYFQQSLELDPSFGPAYAGIADVWGAYAYWGIMPLASVRERIWTPLRAALQLDDAWAEVHMLLGIAYFYLEHDWAAAESHLRRAIELNPNVAHAHQLYGLFTMTLRRPEAIDWIDNAARLDPLNPVVQLTRALLAMSEDRQQDAARCITRVLELDPAHPPGLQLQANLAWHTGATGALALEARLWAQDPEISAVFNDASEDPHTAMLQLAGILRERAIRTYVPPMQLARAYCLGGDLEAALAVLETAQQADDLIQIDLLQSDCSWHPLRPHPRFRQLIATIGIPG